MDDRVAALLELHAFVTARHRERSELVRGTGDALAAGFEITTARVLEQVGRDINDHPWAVAEVTNYLLRSAHRYRRHPDYRW